MRVWDVGRSFATVVLLAEAAARDATVEAVKCEETLVAPLAAVFVGGLADGCGGRVLVLAPVPAAVDALCSGAVESVVVCCSDEVASAALWIVEGRVGLVVGGFTVDRVAVAAVGAEVGGLAGTSR